MGQYPLSTAEWLIKFAYVSDGVLPYAELALPNVVALQPYDVSLRLVVPANDANIALGNFMASLTLSTLSNRTLATSRKPVRPRAYQLGMFETLNACVDHRGSTLCYSLVIPIQ